MELVRGLGIATVLGSFPRAQGWLGRLHGEGEAMSAAVIRRMGRRLAAACGPVAAVACLPRTWQPPTCLRGMRALTVRVVVRTGG